VTVSIEESIQRLKAEVLAQDWRISPRRAARLEEAFDCLSRRYNTRKATLAMLKMAGSVLGYIKTHGGQPSETIDFLKEAMAHVVSLHEDLAYVPEREEEIFRTLFSRFGRLKEKIRTHHGQAAPAPGPPPMVEAEPPPLAGEPSPPPGPRPEARPETAAPPPPAPPAAVSPGASPEKLIEDLREALARAGEVGTTIGRLLETLLSREGQPFQMPDLPGATAAAPAPAEAETPPDPLVADLPEPAPPAMSREIRHDSDGEGLLVKPCPPTEILEVTIGRTRVAIQANLVAAGREVSPRRLRRYLGNGSVPLKEFGRFMRRLSGQFAGSLAAIKDSTLKTLELPIMTPLGLDLPDGPDAEGRHLLVVSSGNWHGIFVCSALQQAPGVMVRFQKMKNGDIAGKGFLEKGGDVLLLDTLSILRREGFLFLP